MYPLDPYLSDLTAQLGAEKDRRVASQLVGLTFTQDVKVEVRKPRWMPARLFRWLFRQVVIIEGPLQIKEVSL